MIKPISIKRLVPHAAVAVVLLSGDFALAQGTNSQLVLGVSHSSRYGGAVDFSLQGQNIAQTGIDADLTWKKGDSGEEYALDIGRDFDLGDTRFGPASELSVDFFAAKQDWEQDDFDSQAAELRVAYSAELAPSVRYSFGVFFRHDEVSGFDPDSSIFISQDAGSSQAAGLLAGLEWDTYHKHGAIAVGSKISGGAQVSLSEEGRRFAKLAFDAQTTQNLTDAVFYDLNFSLGQVSSLGGNDVQVVDRAFTAATPLRGFAYGGYSPRDLATDEALGGQKYMSASAEVIVPVGQRGLSLGAFVDAGAVWDLSDLSSPGIDDDFDLRSSAGLSLRLALENAQIAISIAEPIESRTGDEFQSVALTVGAKF